MTLNIGDWVNVIRNKGYRRADKGAKEDTYPAQVQGFRTSQSGIMRIKVQAEKGSSKFVQITSIREVAHVAHA